MGEPPFRSGEQADPERGGALSKDYWDVVFEQLARRRLFQLGLAVLVLLYASAIYAPFLAGDRPYVLEAVHHKEYEQARKGLVRLTLGLARRVAETPEQYLARHGAGAAHSYAAGLAQEREALAGRLGTLRDHLPPEHHGALAALMSDAERAVALALAGDHAGAGSLARGLEGQAQQLEQELVPRAPGSAAPGVELRSVVTYPLFASTNAGEVFFMVLWAFVLGWPLWNLALNRLLLGGDRERIRRWRRRKLGGVLGCALGAALVWHFAVGGETTFNAAPYKERLTSGEIVATRVLFPPVAFGFAETHLSEQYRPPTWAAAAEISEEGRYVRGPRVPSADEVTGFVPAESPVEVRVAEPARNSPWRHPLGTDSLGRDLLVRALWGGRVSLSVGLVSTLILMVIGVVLGCLAGYFGGRVDLLISRLLEVVLCFPVFFLILVVVAFVGPSILNIMVVIGLVRWTGVARLARGEFLRLRELDFVVAARALGLPAGRTVFRHMLPNALGPLLVAATFSVAAGILVESGLSFLGFGIELPVPSWGALVTESQAHWWLQIFPGLLIFITVLCYNLVGDGIRDAIDPRLKA